MEEDVDSTSSFLSYSQADSAAQKKPYIADAVRNIWRVMSVAIVPDS